MTHRLKLFREFANSVSSQKCELDGSWSTVRNAPKYGVEFEGLSSSWLSGPNDDDGRLVVGQPQIAKLRKTREQGFRIALMHHPLASLLECDRSELEKDLRNDYDVMLRGHLHAPSSREVRDNNKPYVEIATGALYAGSKYPNSFNILDFCFEERVLLLRAFVWHDGQWVPDRLTYPPDGMDTIKLKVYSNEWSAELSQLPQPSESEESGGLIVPTKTGAPLFQIDSSSTTRSEDTGSSDERPTPQKFVIKSDGREISTWHALCDSLANEIRANRPCCVFVPPGFESTDLLPSLVDYCDEHIHENVFYVRGNNLSSSNSLQQALESSLGVSITDFVRHCDRHGGGLLVIDGFRSEKGIDKHSASPTDVQKLIKLIRDYCPELAVVAFSDDPDTPFTHEIEPLDAVAVAEFVRKHELCDFDFKDVARIEGVTDATGGIPLHIIHFMELCRISDFETALNEIRRPGGIRSQVELTEGQRNLLQVDSKVNPGLRNLIDVLAVLERGEPLRAIRSMLSVEQPTIQDVMLLKSQQLATVIRVESPDQSRKEPASVVRLRRHAWDFTNSEMTPQRRTELITLVAEAYFGRNWKSDRIRLRRSGGNTRQRNHDVSRVFANEVFIIEQIFDSVDERDKEALLPVATLALKYCEKLRNQGRFGDAYFASRELLPRVEFACDFTGDADVQEEFRLSTARSSRMAGETDVAIQILAHIEDGDTATEFKERRLDALAALMFCYESDGRPKDAGRVAEKLQKESSTNSWHNIQAAAIRAGLIGDIDEAVKKLTNLEKKARRNNHNVVAENILLDLAYKTASPNQSKKYLQKVRSGDERMYNYVRATARYASLVIENEGVDGLTARDIAAVEAGYTFMFSQRMVTLLTQFHNVIWRILESRQQPERQIELLKHSSFVWRLSGDEETEKKYLRLIEDRCDSGLVGVEAPLRRAVSYVLARLRRLSFDD